MGLEGEAMGRREFLCEAVQGESLFGWLLGGWCVHQGGARDLRRGEKRGVQNGGWVLCLYEQREGEDE